MSHLTDGGQPRSFQLTARDRDIVRWIGRVGVADARQIAARWQRTELRESGASKGMPQSNAYCRLRGLEQRDLLERRRLLFGEPAVFLATRTGLRFAGLDLSPRKVSAGGIAHASRATSLCLELEEEFGTEAVLCEREIRAEDGRSSEPRYAVAADGRLPDGRPRLHFPDFAVRQPPRSTLAIEVELTAKGSQRLSAILRAYVRARHVEGVRYYVSPRAARPVREAIARTRCGPLVDVRVLEH